MSRLWMKTKKQITDEAAKAVRNRIRYQLDLGLWPYRCEKRDEGKRGLEGAEVVK
jgi:hypothetical protein